MGDKLVILAFAGSIVGLFMLFLFVDNLSYDTASIEKINGEEISDMVKLQGEIGDVNKFGNMTFISVEQPSSLDVVVFSPVDLYSGDNVEIIGQSEEYNGKMEVVAHRIRLVN